VALVCRTGEWNALLTWLVPEAGYPVLMLNLSSILDLHGRPLGRRLRFGPNTSPRRLGTPDRLDVSHAYHCKDSVAIAMLFVSAVRLSS
jgi:hypothetical protein